MVTTRWTAALRSGGLHECLTGILETKGSAPSPRHRSTGLTFQPPLEHQWQLGGSTAAKHVETECRRPLLFFPKALRFIHVLRVVCECLFSAFVSEVPVFNASGDVLLYERLTQRLAGWSRGEAGCRKSKDLVPPPTTAAPAFLGPCESLPDLCGNNCLDSAGFLLNFQLRSRVS